VKLLAYVPRDALAGPSRTRLGLLTEAGIRDLTDATGSSADLVKVKIRRLEAAA